MKNMLNIVKKELDKIFKSPRLIFSTFLLPALLIFVMYTFMGSSAKEQTNKQLDHEYTVVMLTKSEEFKKMINESSNILPFKINLKEYDGTVTPEMLNKDTTLYKKMYDSIKNEETDLWVYVPDNFDNISTGNTKGEVTVTMYTHSKNEFSSVIQGTIADLINTRTSALNEYKVLSTSNDIATEKEKGSTLMAMMAPMLIMTFIFAGALSIGADSIAGEKERGTIATMLMAPISKNQIIMGKVVSAIIITIIASICSFIGLMASLKNYISAFGESGVVLNLTAATVIQLFVIIILISLIAVSLFLIASTYAKTTKEATMYAMPVYIIGIISGVFTMFNNSMPTEILPYLIPIYNLTLGLKGIFMNELTFGYFMVIFGSNIVYFILIILLVRQMFKSEKIMFSR
ncbi:MAG: ABC transporter permease subunit [Mollicutes bacterium]|nr:ABC transporter permease subunit [Mollicutes bacterium]